MWCNPPSSRRIYQSATPIPLKTHMKFALRWDFMSIYDELIVAKRLRDFAASCWCDNSNSDRVIISSSSILIVELKMRRI